MKQIFFFLIRFYQSFISPVFDAAFGFGCCFLPTCSEYAYQSIEKHGVVGGSILAIKRIIRCHNYKKEVWDPVK